MSKLQDLVAKLDEAKQLAHEAMAEAEQPSQDPGPTEPPAEDGEVAALKAVIAEKDAKIADLQASVASLPELVKKAVQSEDARLKERLMKEAQDVIDALNEIGKIEVNQEV